MITLLHPLVQVSHGRAEPRWQASSCSNWQRDRWLSCNYDDGNGGQRGRRNFQMWHRYFAHYRMVHIRYVLLHYWKIASRWNYICLLYSEASIAERYLGDASDQHNYVLSKTDNHIHLIKNDTILLMDSFPYNPVQHFQSVKFNSQLTKAGTRFDYKVS